MFGWFWREAEQLISRLPNTRNEVKIVAAFRMSRLDRALMGAAFLIAVLGFLSPDKIRVGGGFGWDGSLYGAWVKHFNFLVLERKADDYYVSKILPAAVIHYGMRLFGIPFTDENIICAFGVLNASLICVGAYVWLRIASHLKLTGQGKALGFIGLFLNYAVIKAPSYYPVLNDTAGWFGGLLLVALYLTARRWLMILALPFVAFTWPALLLEGALLLALPAPAGAGAAQQVPGVPWHGLLAGFAAVAVLIGILRCLREDNRLVTPMVYLGAVLCAAYVFMALGGLWKWDQLFRLRFWIGEFRVSILLALLAFIAVKVLVRMLTGAVSGLTVRTFLHQIAWTGTMQPGVFLVAHINFFGPLLLVALFRWNDVCIAIRKLGAGFTAVASLALLLSIDSESRHIVSFLPVLVIPVVCAAERNPWRWAHVALFGMLSVVFAKPWLIIGDNLQLYYLSQGPYMTVSDYRLYLLALTLLSGITYWILRQSPQAALSEAVPVQKAKVERARQPKPRKKRRRTNNRN